MQTFSITILSDTRVLSQEECRDMLQIVDTEQTIYSTCTQEHPPFEVVSGSESVQVCHSY